MAPSSHRHRAGAHQYHRASRSSTLSRDWRGSGVIRRHRTIFVRYQANRHRGVVKARERSAKNGRREDKREVIDGVSSMVAMPPWPLYRGESSWCSRVNERAWQCDEGALPVALPIADGLDHGLQHQAFER